MLQPEARAAEAGGEAEVEAQEHAQERVRACSNLQGHLWESVGVSIPKETQRPGPLTCRCAPPPVDCSARILTEESEQV